MDMSLKVIVVGNGMVGKTSMITRFARGVMTENYKKTIGTDFMEKEIVVRATGDNIKLMLWDTAGQEMFSKLTRQYYRGAGAVVYVFSTVDRDSFLEVERWKHKVDAECGDNIVAVLVQNKCDLIDQAAMTREEVEDLARRMGVKLYRTCVKDNILVDDVFDYVSEQFIRTGGATSSSHEPVPEIATLSVEHNAAVAAAQGNNTNTNNANNSTPSTSTPTNSAHSSDASSTQNPSSSSSLNGSHNSSAAPAASPTSPTSSSSSSSSSSAPAPGTAKGGAFKLEPLTSRRQGKKKTIGKFCTIL